MENIWLKMVESDFQIINEVLKYNVINIKSVIVSMYSMLHQIILKCFKSLFVKDSVKFYVDNMSFYSLLIIFKSRYLNNFSVDLQNFLESNVQVIESWNFLIYCKDDEDIDSLVENFALYYSYVKRLYKECKDYIEKV